MQIQSGIQAQSWPIGKMTAGKSYIAYTISRVCDICGYTICVYIHIIIIIASNLYMIMALMAALLMRLRCFLLRRGEAGRKGAFRADGKIGATVEGTKKIQEKVESTVNLNLKHLCLRA